MIELSKDFCKHGVLDGIELCLICEEERNYPTTDQTKCDVK